ncbi:hypothetical protein Bpfe_021750, partial [Biomphalaria pfeifferi]
DADMNEELLMTGCRVRSSTLLEAVYVDRDTSICYKNPLEENEMRSPNDVE